MEFFVWMSKKVAHYTGHPFTFLLAVFVVVAWAISGPIFGFSDTWQLVINTGTTIITFLMVFVIQSTQNRDTEAMHLKLDEIIRSIGGAQNSVLNLEELTEEELDKIKARYLKLAKKAKGTTTKQKKKIKPKNK